MMFDFFRHLFSSDLMPSPTALQRAHDELKASEARFRGFLDSAPDAMVIADANGTIVLANAQAQKLFGYSFDELLGRPVELLLPEAARSVHSSYRSAFAKEPKVRSMGTGLELFGRHKDGREFPIEVSLSPMMGPDGLTVSAAIRDISDRKRLETEAMLAADRLKNAVESMQDGFALFDENDRLVLCNSVYRRLVGDSLTGSIVGRSYAEIAGAWARDNLTFESAQQKEQFRADRLTPTKTTRTIDIRTHDGRTLRVVDRRTSDGGIVKTVQDLTDDHRLAEELREARAAAEAGSAAKSDFLASMSHELRTPLNAVLGFAQLLQGDKKAPLSEHHRERVDHIVRGGEHLLRLIDDVLDLSKIEAGRISISPEPVSVGEILEKVKTTLEPMAVRQGIELVVEPPPASCPLVLADRTRFSQVLMNFGSNAIKYNRARGNVTFSVELADARHVRVSVGDTGIGIPVEKQGKIFQPFQRAGQETGPIEGTGIGLSITKRLAELMLGSVGFQSTPNAGSQFWIDMPVSSSRPASLLSDVTAARARDTRADDKRHLILYVEDNPANIVFMRDLMNGFDNVDLISVPSAELGVDIACARHPEIIIMDINLPGMSGLEALAALRADPDTAAIPVIAVTAAASERDQMQGTAAGFRRYLTKPLRVDEFIAVIESLLEVTLPSR